MPILKDLTLYLFRARHVTLIALLLCLLLGLLLLTLVLTDSISLKDDVLKPWSEYVDPFIGMATLLVAILVWFGELRQEWRDNMSSRLTVRFHCDGQPVMRCELAHLTSEADIRNLAQQIGQQMNKNQRLNINAPDMKKSGGDTEINNDGQVFRHWFMDIPLYEPPSIMNEAPHPHGLFLWSPPFSEGPSWQNPDP